MDPKAQLSDYLNLSARTATFVSIDVVGSTTLKIGQNEQDIIYTFLAYHKLASDIAYLRHGEVFNISGDGMMLRFQRPADAYDFAKDLLGQLPIFNKKQNHLTQTMSLRLGLHTGQVLENESLGSGQVISKTIDIAAKLQQSADPDQARLSEATATQLGVQIQEVKRIGWDARYGMNVYSWSPQDSSGTVRGVRQIPSPLRVIALEQDPVEVSKLKRVPFGGDRDVFFVFNQNQAALVLHAWKPHLIITDLDLPWKTGWEFLGSIRGDAHYSSVPVIASSSSTTGDTIQRSFQMGANGFLRKPFEEQQILKRVEMVLREFYL